MLPLIVLMFGYMLPLIVLIFGYMLPLINIWLHVATNYMYILGPLVHTKPKSELKVSF
jgi:hypothetical protein